jgi:hypothetical protein
MLFKLKVYDVLLDTQADFDLISSSTRVTRVPIELQNLPELPNCETKMASSALPCPTNPHSSIKGIILQTRLLMLMVSVTK